VLQASSGIAAALAVATGVLGWRAVTLQSDLDATTARIANLETVLASSDGMMSVATNPAHLTVVLHAEPLAPTATAVLMFVPGSTQAYLAADHLPATPAGQAYQLWYADAAGVHPLGVSRFDGAGAFIAPLGVDLGNAAAVMITLEAAGGATGDPGPQVIFGEL
jgi:hypothetical protein